MHKDEMKNPTILKVAIAVILGDVVLLIRQIF